MKKLLIIALAVILVFTIATTALSGSASTVLNTNETASYSSGVSGRNGYSTGYNYTTSAYYVRLHIQYSYGSGYTTRSYEVMEQGESETTPTYTASQDALWRVKLAPQSAWPFNCTATGTVHSY